MYAKPKHVHSQTLILYHHQPSTHEIMPDKCTRTTFAHLMTCYINICIPYSAQYCWQKRYCFMLMYHRENVKDSTYIVGEFQKYPSPMSSPRNLIGHADPIVYSIDLLHKVLVDFVVDQVCDGVVHCCLKSLCKDLLTMVKVHQASTAQFGPPSLSRTQRLHALWERPARKGRAVIYFVTVKFYS